ncbi:MAG: hypothetical protein OXD37_08650 [Acidimicrobiaceae bacterium]|nr:hypothetical protein [Acidimicrobiaceae bacterium]
MAMEPRVWVNPRQPQTLYVAQLLMYLRGGFLLLFGVVLGGSASMTGLLFALGSVAAAYGVANERRWGYRLGLVVAVFALAVSLLTLSGGLSRLLSQALGLVFDVALVALLLHPLSRNYLRYWPKGRSRR